MKRYVCLDLEMSEVTSKQRRYIGGLRNEIIQIGAVMLDEKYKIIGKFSNYVKPSYSHITEKIENLTGIKEENIENADDLITVMDKLIYWIGDNDVTTYCWSPSDYNQIWNEIMLKAKHRNDIFEYLKTFVDLQKTFSNLLSTNKPISLDSAIALTREKFVGQHHTAFSDAYNTACVLYKISHAKGINPTFEYLYLTSEPEKDLIQKDKVKKQTEKLVSSKEYTNSFCSFIDKELLEKWGLAEKYQTENELTNQINIKDEGNKKSQNKIMLSNINLVKSLRRLKEKLIAKIVEKTVYCKKYGIPLNDFINFSIRMQFTESLNVLI